MHALPTGAASRGDRVTTVSRSADVRTEVRPMTVLIADDEPPARHGVRSMLAAHADLQVIGEASSGAEAIAAIESLRPDLVFLDVQMPDGTGFDVVRAIGAERMPIVIFSTAFDEYALQAFDAHALDYLLKPYDRSRFDTALQRARAQVQRHPVNERLLQLLDRMDRQSRWLPRLIVRHGTKSHFVPTASLDYLEADGNYVRLHVGTQSWLVRDTLANLESQLDPSRFLRVHRSLIVHLARVTSAESLHSGEFVLTLTTGRKLTSGRTFRSAVQAALGL